MAQTPRGLHAPLSHFVVNQKPFADALLALAAEVRWDVAIGFEQAIAQATEPLLDVNIDHGTVEDALAAMCSDRRYTYAEVQPGMVEVRPSQEPAELKTLLDLPVPSFDLDRHEWPKDLFRQIPGLVHEVGSYLNDKVMVWSRQTGRRPPARAGSDLGDGSPPHLEIHLQNTNVRGVLDGLALYVTAHAAPKELVRRAGNPGYDPQGWRVEFTRDPQAPTGLGGYVKWSALP